MRNIAPPSPAETLQGEANSRTKPRRLDAREVLVTAGQMSCFFFFCASSVIESHGYCRSHNHTATRSAMLQSIMPSAHLARYRLRAVCETLLRRLLRRSCKAEQIPVRVRTMFALSISNILSSVPLHSVFFLHVLPRRIKRGTRLGDNILTSREKYGIIISSININLIKETFY